MDGNNLEDFTTPTVPQVPVPQPKPFSLDTNKPDASTPTVEQKPYIGTPKTALDTQPSIGDKNAAEYEANHPLPVTGALSLVPGLDTSAMLVDSAKRSFLHQNILVDTFNRIDQLTTGLPDPSYNADEYIKAHKINEEDGYQFRLLNNAQSADKVRRDMQEKRTNAEILSKRHGVSNFIGSALGQIIDVDTPITIMAGPLLGAGVKFGRVGRALSGAVSGGAIMTASQGYGEMISTVPDWTAVPQAGFMGMLMGGAGGFISRSPGARPEASQGIHVDTEISTAEQKLNSQVLRAQTDFSEQSLDGIPLSERPDGAQRQAVNDSYGTIAKEADELAAKQAEEEAAKAATGDGKKPVAKKVEDIKPEDLKAEVTPESISDAVQPQGSTVGAKQLNATGPGKVRDKSQQRTIDLAKAENRRLGLGNQYFDGILNTKLAQENPKLARAVQGFVDLVNSTPLAADFDRMFRSGSAVAAKAAYDLFEHPIGLLRNNQSGAMLKHQYLKDMLGKIVLPFDRAWSGFAKDEGLSMWEKVSSAEARDRFDRMVISELQARAYDGPAYQPSGNRWVMAAADAHDAMYKREVEILKGSAGEQGVHGAENLDSYPGYYSQRWDGSKIRQAIEKNGEKDVHKAIQEALLHQHQALKPNDAMKIAKAVTERALSYEAGVSTSLIGILQADGRSMLRDVLKRNGISEKEADSLLDKLTYAQDERGKMSSLKSRVDLDLRFVSQSGIQIMDLMDTNVMRTAQRRAHSSAGAGAMARKGIRSRSDMNHIIDTILSEQQANGQSAKTGSKYLDFVSEDRHLSRTDLEDMFSAFTQDAGMTARMTNPWLSRMMKLTNLSLLSQVGFAQLAETGAQMGEVGWAMWKKHAGREFMDMLHNKDSDLVKELKHMNVFVPEEGMFRPDLWNDLDSVGTTASDLLHTVDRTLNVGSRINSIVSGYYKVKDFQTRVALTSMTDKIMRNLAGHADDLSIERMQDIGLSTSAGADAATIPAIKQLIKSGVIEFEGEHLKKLNLDQWPVKARQDFVAAINRSVNQLVQGAMAGETNSLFSRNGIARALVHLKTFPLLAVQKQAVRSLAHYDHEAMMGVMYGLATAGLAYTAKQVVNLQTDNLSAERVAKGAFNMSNITGWVPMWIDPMAAMLGMDSIQLSGYGGRGGQDILSTPPVISTGNKLLRIPGAAIHTLTGQMSNGDINAFKAFPIVGQMVGFAGALNALKN